MGAGVGCDCVNGRDCFATRVEARWGEAPEEFFQIGEIRGNEDADNATRCQIAGLVAGDSMKRLHPLPCPVVIVILTQPAASDHLK